MGPEGILQSLFRGLTAGVAEAGGPVPYDVARMAILQTAEKIFLFGGGSAAATLTIIRIVNSVFFNDSGQRGRYRN